MKRFLIAAVLAALCAAAPLKAEPLVDFSHRYARFHTTMKLSRVKKLERYLPKKLRREIGDEYYPQIRESLSKADTMSINGASISVEHQGGDTLEMRMVFPVFIMTLRDITWEDLDDIYFTYFAPDADTGREGDALPAQFRE